MGFDPKVKRLRCMGHILNLIAEAYLYGQDASDFEKQFKEQGLSGRRKMWRDRGELGKLHNLVAHVMASGKRSELFTALQSTENVGKAAGKRWKLVLDGGIRWNATYSMIRRALELKQALITYAAQLRVSTDPLDTETYDKDYLSDSEWKNLEVIKDHLELLFHTTKALEGNADFKDGDCKASHGQLGELLPVFEYILTHFEGLEKQAKAGDFDNHPGIARSINLAWNKASDYYGKTDESVAWIASTVLNPKFKLKYFEDKWTGSESHFLRIAKGKVKKLWEDVYKRETMIIRPQSPLPASQPADFLADILNRVAPQVVAPTRVSTRKDQYTQYLEEPVSNTPIMLYWRAKEPEWPQLASMAFDFLAIPAMSSECERVFSSCAKQTTPESSRLTGRMLWHQECLNNWQRRGAIRISQAFNAVVIDWGADDSDNNS
jgi:hypothetical protein